MKNILKYFEILIRIVFPPKCIFCGKMLEYTRKNSLLVCDKCALTLPNITQNGYNVSSFLYKDGVKNAIHKFKFKNKKSYGETLAHFMTYAARYSYKENHFDYLIPIPLSKKRFRDRGYNQSEVLGKFISKDLGIPMLTNILFRIRDSKPQSELAAKERRKNIIGAFAVQNAPIIKGKSVLLIDDVYTTGSTIDECRRMLFSNGAKDVYCLTIATTGR